MRLLDEMRLDRRSGGHSAALSAIDRSVHVARCSGRSEYLSAHAIGAAIVELDGARTLLSVPLLAESEVHRRDRTLGRTEVRPFTDKQIELLQTSPTRP